MDEKERFKEYISVDGVDNENESQNISVKQPKTKKEQYEKIEDFYRKHNEELIDKDKFNVLWNNLTTELNDIGPPVHTETEWKRKWSVQKYNKKRRKRLSDSKILESVSRLDEPSNYTQPSSEFVIDFHPEVLEKLCEISEKQDVMIQNQDTIKQNQDAIKQNQEKSNTILEQIAMKLSFFKIENTDV